MSQETPTGRPDEIRIKKQRLVWAAAIIGGVLSAAGALVAYFGGAYLSVLEKAIWSIGEDVQIIKTDIVRRTEWAISIDRRMDRIESIILTPARAPGLIENKESAPIIP